VSNEQEIGLVMHSSHHLPRSAQEACEGGYAIIMPLRTIL